MLNDRFHRSLIKVFWFMMFAGSIAGHFGTAEAQETEATLPLLASQYEVDRLAPGLLSGRAEFFIDESDFISIEIIAELENLTTRILAPKGEVINEGTIASFDGVFNVFGGIADSDSSLIIPAITPGSHYVYSFPSLGVGTYTVEFEAGPDLGEDVGVITQVLTDSTAVVTLLVTQATVSLGDSVVLTVPFFDGTTPVPGADIKVTILRENDPPVELTLLDDGDVGDDLAGDGLYSAEFIPEMSGDYEASATIEGANGEGTPCFREAGSQFTVLERTSQLTGLVMDHGVDSNGNGLFEAIVIDTETNTVKAGSYRVFVRLMTTNGQRLTRSAEASLSAGITSIPVSFEAAAIRSLGEDGPFDIELVELIELSDDGANPADSLEDLGQTQAYLISQLEEPGASLTGVTSDEGVDFDGDGLFDELRTTVQINIVTGGLYNWGLKLADQTFGEIDFATNSGFLDTGLNDMVVHFDGEAIGTSGINGPYLLRDLLLEGPENLIATAVGETQAYRASQFEGQVTTCVSGPTLLCLNDDRFRVELDWRDPTNNTGMGRVVPLRSADSGLLGFVDTETWQILVKVLSGCDYNNHFWVFAAAATDFEYTLRVTDTAIGSTVTYFNPLGNVSPAFTDTRALETCQQNSRTTHRVVRLDNPEFQGEDLLVRHVTMPSATNGCTPSSNRLCLQHERFAVEVRWRDLFDNSGPGKVVPGGTNTSGLLWFFSPQNWEMLIRIVDGCQANGHLWVFAAAPTNMEYTLRVTDTTTGEVREYFNPLLTSANPVLDTNAFSACP